ncbi:hypothetical protein D3C81_988990 [compost metagenome]
MARIRIAARETARGGQHELRMLRRHAGAVAVADARRHREGGGLGAGGDVDGGLGIDGPGMEQVQILRRALQQFFLGQARALVFRGEAGDVVGRLGGGAQRGRREVRGAGVAAALADHHRDADHLVAVLLDRFHLPLAHRYGQAAAFGDLRGGVGRAQFACHTQHIGGHLAELGLGVGEMRGLFCDLVHVGSVPGGHQKSKRQS